MDGDHLLGISRRETEWKFLSTLCCLVFALCKQRQNLVACTHTEKSHTRKKPLVLF